MGCDIHAFTEVKIAGTWHTVTELVIDRDYELFAKMAGVRGDAEPIAPLRGFPSDAGFMTKFIKENQWGPDGHSHSWLSLEEANKVEEWHDNRAPGIWRPVFGYLFGNGWSRDSLRFGVEDARVVFWFDC